MEFEIKGVEMVRSIRDVFYEDIRDLTPVKLMAFIAADAAGTSAPESDNGRRTADPLEAR